MKEIAKRIRKDVGDLHDVYRRNYVPMGGNYQTTAAQQAVQHVIDALENAIDDLDIALEKAEKEGTFDSSASDTPPV